MVVFGESVRHIRDSVKFTLTGELRKKIPGVAEELTGVFATLTKHSHFDRLVIDEESLPSLKLGVASSNDSFSAPHPTGVLNGQAQSALALVPYFALSQAAEAPTEVYLVLLDDPTRAFDREHIKILIERLADLGKRVQVIVATQGKRNFPRFIANQLRARKLCGCRTEKLVVRRWTPTGMRSTASPGHAVAVDCLTRLQSEANAGEFGYKIQGPCGTRALATESPRCEGQPYRAPGHRQC